MISSRRNKYGKTEKAVGATAFSVSVMEKFMKFPMYEKETKDENYRNNPFRAVNFKTDPDGSLLCPNNRKFKFFPVFSFVSCQIMGL